MCPNLQHQLIYLRRVTPRIHQNGSFLIPTLHLALQVDNLELETSLLKKFTSQLQNSHQITKLDKVALELSTGES